MQPHRLGALDALRGLAALAVAVFHLQQVHLSGQVFPHAYLAVDFFFALSGFVIAHTYETKIRGGLPITSFFVRRLIRLYPMVLFGVGFGLFVLGTKLLTDASRIDSASHILVSAAANLILLPTPYASEASRGFLYLTDAPLWSVAFEVFINLCWCVALARLSTRRLAVVTVVCLLGLVLAAWRHGTVDIGFDWATIDGGFARVGFGFSLGLLVYRLRDRIMLTRNHAVKLASAAVLVGTFAIPQFAHGELAAQLIGVTVLMPLVLILALNSTDHARLDKALGDASYPLYAVHFPILLLASGVHQKVPQLDVGVLLTGTAIFMALTTMLVTRLYDEPMRRALAARWAGANRPWPAGSIAPEMAC